MAIMRSILVLMAVLALIGFAINVSRYYASNDLEPLLWAAANATCFLVNSYMLWVSRDY